MTKHWWRALRMAFLSALAVALITAPSCSQAAKVAGAGGAGAGGLGCASSASST